MQWIDEKNPPIEVTCDVLNQRLQFEDRNLIGTGTNSNFNSFKIFGASTATSTNNLGIPTRDDTTTTALGVVRSSLRLNFCSRWS